MRAREEPSEATRRTHRPRFRRCGLIARGALTTDDLEEVGMGFVSDYRKKRQERRRKRDQVQAEARKSLHDEPSGANYQSAQNKIDKWS